MPDVRIDTDEMYPVYFITRNDASCGEVAYLTDEELAQVKAADEAFDAAQEILRIARERGL